MKAFRDRSIRQKLTMIMMLTSWAALLLACGAFLSYELVTFRSETVRGMTSLAQVIAANSEAALLFDDSAAAEENLAALASEQHVVAAYIYLNDGRIFARYNSTAEGKRIPAPPAEAPGHRFSDGNLHLFLEIDLNGEVVGSLYMRSDLRAQTERLRRYAMMTGLIIATLLLLTLLLSAWLQRLISRPIVDLAETARTVSHQQDYSVRAERRDLDEIGALIDHFNEMMVSA